MGVFAAALADAFEVSTGAIDGSTPALNAINTMFQPGPFLNAADWEDEHAPKAFINYILFDADYIPYDMGFDQIDAAALEDGSGVPHDHMPLQAVATKPGYIYIYLSNESDKVVDVYFDDLYISHTFSPIVAGSDYYPFGLPMEGRQVTLEDWRYGYQGAFAEQDEETGYTAFELRMYDARFGRWTGTDPYGQYWSPYVGMGNMPQMSIDPDGGWSWVGAGIGAVVAGYAGGAISSGEMDPRKWEREDWAWAAAGFAAGGFVGGVIDNNAGRSLGNNLRGQYNNKTTNNFNWKADWKHPIKIKSIGRPLVPATQLIQLGLNQPNEVPLPRDRGGVVRRPEKIYYNEEKDPRYFIGFGGDFVKSMAAKRFITESSGKIRQARRDVYDIVEKGFVHMEVVLDVGDTGLKADAMKNRIQNTFKGSPIQLEANWFNIHASPGPQPSISIQFYKYR